MKTRLFVVALLVAVVGFGGCKKDPKKSSECDILEFKLNGVEYQKNGTTFSKMFGKSDALTWDTGCPTTPAKPEIRLSPKAKIVGTPNEDTLIGFDGLNENFSVTYKVEAEDGTPQNWTVSAQRSMTY